MAQVVEAATADLAWRAAAQAIMSEQTRSGPQASRGGATAELMNAMLIIADPRQRWVASRLPAINPAFAIAEAAWILAGRDDSGLLTYFNRSLMRYAGAGPVFHGAYGARIRRRHSLDQLQRAYDVLRHDADSRQVVLQIWDCCADLPNSDGRPADMDIPCNVIAMLKVRDGALHWTQIMRSNDIFRGLPHNLIQWTSMQEVMSGWLGLRLGRYVHYADSLHAYVDDLPLEVDCDLTVSENSDSLAMPKPEFDSHLVEFVTRMERIADESNQPHAIEKLIAWDGAPEVFHNLLMVLIAEGLRRRAATTAAAEAMRRCTNPILRQVWQRWLNRVMR
jgi:thymidylate synthase